MSKFNRAHAVGPAATEATPSGLTHEGAPGYARDTRSELRLLAVTNMVGEDTFYERAGSRDDRYCQLVQTCAIADPAWTAGFLRWLRTEANMRSAALVGAAEFVAARRTIPREQLPRGADGIPAIGNEYFTNRRVVSSVLQRADEPGEFLAFWASKYGTNFPMPVKRGVADAVVRLYSEYSVAKYDSATAAYRPADVIELCHPLTDAPWQNDLFRYLLDVRHGNHNGEVPATLPLLAARAQLLALPVPERRALLAQPDASERLIAAGMTHEALGGWLQGPMTGQAWDAIAPGMGYAALLKNLRNFDEAGISQATFEAVSERLARPAAVASSRQLPMRFLSAHRAATDRWAPALEAALELSLGNIPALSGRTLVLVDTSSSMNDTFSRDGTLMRWDAAVVFGLALARRCERADVVSFSSGRQWLSDAPAAKTKVFDLAAGESLLAGVARWQRAGFFLGGGTDTDPALRRHVEADHDRVVILTDEQAAHGGEDVGAGLPMPIFTFNLAGYERGHAPSNTDGRRWTLGGLSDQAFSVIPILESAELPVLTSA
jgi:hypothetical protein